MLLAVYFVPVLMTVFVRLRTFEGQVYPYTMSGLITGWVLPIYLIVLIAESVTDDYVAGTMSLSLIHPVSRIQLITASWHYQGMWDIRCPLCYSLPSMG